MLKREASGRLGARRLTALIALPLVCFFVCLCLGRMMIAPGAVLRALFGRADSPQIRAVVWSMRVPRLVLSALVGAGLSLSGCVFQGLFSNPLATPDTLGVASGASAAPKLALLLGFSMTGVQLLSLASGVAALALSVLTGTGRGRRGLSGVVLSGIMIGSLFTALVSMVKFAADTESQLPAITYWLMGSLDSAGYASLALGAPPIALGVTVLLLLRWRLNLLPLSDEEARSTGTNLTLLRGATALCATIITASCVSMCGQVGWVGLLVPHMCRMLFGNNHLRLLPASALLGAAFLVVVDTLARSISASEIPISILTAILGAPFFIALMRRSEGWQL